MYDLIGGFLRCCCCPSVYVTASLHISRFSFFFIYLSSSFPFHIAFLPVPWPRIAFPAFSLLHLYPRNVHSVPSCVRDCLLLDYLCYWICHQVLYSTLSQSKFHTKGRFEFDYRFKRDFMYISDANGTDANCFEVWKNSRITLLLDVYG